MSWEGYGQALCEKGHAFTINQYFDTTEVLCPDCPIETRKEAVWINWVDQTNGCYCRDEAYTAAGYKCPAHPLKLEVLEEATFKECEACKHRELTTHATYKRPAPLKANE